MQRFKRVIELLRMRVELWRCLRPWPLVAGLVGAGGLVVLALAIATRASLMPHAWLDFALLLYLRVALLAGSIYLVFNGVTLDDRLSFLGNRSGLRETATGSHKRRLPPARHPRTA